MSIIGSLRRVLFGPPADADPRDARLTEYAIGAKGYVHVEEDGEARELSEDEVEYLNTAFHPCDGARPYIKDRYAELTPDGRISEFLRRDRLPRGKRVARAPPAAAP